MVGLIETLHRDLENGEKSHVEWYDKLHFIVDGEPIEAQIYLFKSKEAADTYRRDEGVLFTYNGQSHATISKDFFRRKKVKHDYLWHSLLVFVDCSKIGRRAHEKLFMNSRDRLRDGELKSKLEAELEDQLARNQKLRELGSERRKRELSEQPKANETMAKAIESFLSKNPALAALLGHGLRIRNPHKPESAGTGIAGFIGKRFPTKFQFKGHDSGFQLVRDAHIGGRVRVTFETDAANDYFKREEQPGSFELLRVTLNGKVPVKDYQWPRLHDGMAHLTLSLPDETHAGDDLQFEAITSDPSRIEPFRNPFILTVLPERETSNESTGGTRRANNNQEGHSGDGSTGTGTGGTKDSSLDIPEPFEVYQKEWNNRDPAFDKFTSMRIKRRPDTSDDEDLYDFYINMDNVYLEAQLKAKPKEATSAKQRYKLGMTLVALSILHQEQVRKKDARKSEDMPDGTVEPPDRVAQVTSALAPFLLPMIESVGTLEELDDDEPLSESAGEAA
jgi:hypothetical protein